MSSNRERLWTCPALIVLGLCLAGSASAQITQNSVQTWGGAADDYLIGTYLHAGDYYLVGGTTSFGQQDDILVTRFNSSGMLQWAKTWGTSNVDQGEGHALDPAGGIYVAGDTPGASNSDILFLRFDLTGAPTLATTWDSGGRDQASTVFLDAGGNVYLTGGTTAGGLAFCDVLLMKYAASPSGTTAPSIVKQWPASAAGLGDDSINGGCIDGSSGTEFIYVAGNTTSFTAGGYDLLVQKYDSTNLNLIWSRTWGGTGNDDAYSMAVDGLGNVYTAGATDSYGEGGQDALLLKWNDQGDLQWARVWGTDGDEGFDGISADECSGNVYLGGSTSLTAGGSYDGLMLKFGPDGTLQWSKTWGANGQDEGLGTPLVQGGTIRIAGGKGCSAGTLADVVGTLTDVSAVVAGSQDHMMHPAVNLAVGTPVQASLTSTCRTASSCQAPEAMFLEFGPGSPIASASTRNCAPNPASYTADPPVLGACWTASVDLTTTGHSNAIVLIYAAPIQVPLSSGQCVLIGSNRLFKLPAMAGPMAEWNFVVPYDLSLIGLTIYSQAVHVLGVAPFALSNAVDMSFGF